MTLTLEDKKIFDKGIAQFTEEQRFVLRWIITTIQKVVDMQKSS